MLLITVTSSFTLHKYYMSLCEIEYVKKEKAVQILLNIFIDDLEATLNKEQNKLLYLATEKEDKNIKTIYKNYLNQHFKIQINHSKKSYQYIGHKYDDEIVTFYLEIPNIKHINSFQIKNTCLFKLFNTQKNIIKLKINEQHKTFFLTTKNDKGLLKF